MDKYVIHGGVPLKGSVLISGSKNAALPIMAASLLTKEDIILNNVPTGIRDIRTMISLLAMLGKKVVIEPDRLIIQTKEKHKYIATYEIVKQMRASIVVLGPLLAICKKADISLPGGCAFGPRPIDLHIKGMEALGADIKLKHGYIEARSQKLKGGQVNLIGEFGPSVLGTDNVLMAATLAKGKTIIENAAREPETADLTSFLQAMGANISGKGTSTLTIKGVKKLHGCEYTIIQDRIEAATFACAGASTGGDIKLKYRYPEHIESMTNLLKEIGVGVSYRSGFYHVKGKPTKTYKGFTVTTMPFPGFPTDMQSLFMALAMVINGNSTITEGIYPNRFNHAPEMVRLGGDIVIEKSTAIIKGGKRLSGASVQASDLRAGAALIIAALAGKGRSEIHRVYHVERGYEHFPEKLKALGAKIDIKKAKVI